VETIEPVKFRATSSGFDIKDSYRARLHGFGGGWNKTHDFLLHEAMSEYFDELSPVTLSEKYMDVIQEEEIDKISDVSPHVVDYISPEPTETLGGPPPTSTLYVASDSIVIPNQTQEGIFYILSNNKNRARKKRDDIIADFIEMEDDYEHLGMEDIELKYGSEFTVDSLSNVDNVSEVNIGEPDEFEQQVYEELEPLSEAFVNNVTIDFGDYNANPECDVIISLSPANRIYVEVKDYSGVDNAPNENDIIDTPLKKSGLLNVDLTLSVVKGVSDSKMTNFKSSAELRENIMILQKDDVLEYICDHIEQTLPRSSMRQFRWRIY
jgi:hypothetical protein